MVHIAGHHLRGIVLCNGHDCFLEGAAAVETAHEIDDGGAVGIIHNGVQLRVGKVGAASAVGGFAGSVLPHLAQHQSIGLQLFDPVVEQLQEFVGQLICHVQTETVCTQLQPVGDDTVFVGDDILDEGGIHFVDGGQGVEIPPTVVGVRPLIEGIPAVVGGFGITVGTLAGERAVFVEIQTVGAGVGIHTIQNDFDAALMGSITHGLEVCNGTQHGVGGLIVTGIVAVAGKTLGNGV